MICTLQFHLNPSHHPWKIVAALSLSIRGRTITLQPRLPLPTAGPSPGPLPPIPFPVHHSASHHLRAAHTCSLHRVALREARARTIEASILTRPGGVVESDPRRRARQDHGYHPVITSDIASLAGLQIDRAEHALQGFAVDAKASWRCQNVLVEAGG